MEGWSWASVKDDRRGTFYSGSSHNMDSTFDRLLGIKYNPGSTDDQKAVSTCEIENTVVYCFQKTKCSYLYNDDMASTRWPHCNHMVAIWCLYGDLLMPHGSHIMVTRSPNDHHIVSKWLKYADHMMTYLMVSRLWNRWPYCNHILKTWSPHEYHVVTTWWPHDSHIIILCWPWLSSATDRNKVPGPGLDRDLIQNVY